MLRFYDSTELLFRDQNGFNSYKSYAATWSINVDFELWVLIERAAKLCFNTTYIN